MSNSFINILKSFTCISSSFIHIFKQLQVVDTDLEIFVNDLEIFEKSIEVHNCATYNITSPLCTYSHEPRQLWRNGGKTLRPQYCAVIYILC